MTLRPLTLIGIILSIVTGLALGVLAHLHTRPPESLESAQIIERALQQVGHSYVEAISEEVLRDRALHGMMQGLDPYSDFLSARQFNALRASTSGRFGGIGIELSQVDGAFTVIAPLDNTPADRAGLMAGDQIVDIDAQPVRGLTLSHLIERLRGEPGSSVALRVLRGDHTVDFEVIREMIKVASVRGRLLEPGYAYLRISQFQHTTDTDLVRVLEDLRRDNQENLSGLIIDLRNNPGGTLRSSVAVVDHFLESGLIVYTEGRLRSSSLKYRASRGDLLQGGPLVVLINQGSASAAEIVAGALQDHSRAKIIGTRSYGKGSVQSVLPLDDEQAIKITTAYYFTPNGRSIHEAGIEPDITFEGDEAMLLDTAIQLLKSESAERRQARG